MAVPRAAFGLGALALLTGALLLAGSLYDRPPVAAGAWLAAAGLEARHETVDGRRLRYVRAGRGPAVVLVHGLASSLYTWKDVIAPLALDHDVVALDLPGFGGSDQPADLTFEDLPRAVLGLMDRLGIERAALVGNSLGGGAAALVAARRPGRVTALVLVDAAGFNLEPGERPGMVRFGPSSAGSALFHLPGKRVMVELGLRQVFHDPSRVTDERVSEYLAAALRPGTLPSIRSLDASLGARTDVVREALPRIQAPTLVLWGSDDRWIPVAHADRFAAAIPGARKLVIEGCGHVPQEERPEELLRLVREFLATAAPGPGGSPWPSAPGGSSGTPSR